MYLDDILVTGEDDWGNPPGRTSVRGQPTSEKGKMSHPLLCSWATRLMLMAYTLCKTGILLCGTVAESFHKMVQ